MRDVWVHSVECRMHVYSIMVEEPSKVPLCDMP
jgi:hypothetical protein